MGVFISSTLRRGQSEVGAFALAEEKDIKISRITVADITARDNIESWRRSSKMEVKVIDATPEAVGTAYYELQVDLTSWTDVTLSIPDNVLIDTDILDGDGYIKSNLIQNLFINDAFVVADETAMLALTTVTGNAVIQTGDGSVWIKLNNDDPSDIADFADITGNTGAVTSVNGQTGAVSITMANLMLVAQNVTDFNAQVNLVPELIANTAAIVVLQNDVTTINAAIAALQGLDGERVKKWLITESYSAGELIYFLNSNGDNELFEVIQNTPVAKSPDDGDAATYFKVIGAYYNKTEIDNALALKADLIAGKIPISQIPTSLLGIQITDTIITRDALVKFEGLRVLVLDATADPLIINGSAEYVQDSDHPSADSEGYVLIPGSNNSFIPVTAGDGTKFLADNSSTVYKRVEATYKELNLVSHGFAINSVLARSGANYVLSTTDELTPIGIVVEVIDVDNILIWTGGFTNKLSGLTANTKYYKQDTGLLGTTETNTLMLQSVSTTEAFLFASGGGGSSYIPPDPYDTIAALLAAQGDHEKNREYYVEDATTDGTVTLGKASYRYDGVANGLLSDYTKTWEGEAFTENALATYITSNDAAVALKMAKSANLSDVASKDAANDNLIKGQSIRTFTLADELTFDDFRGKKSTIQDGSTRSFTLASSGNLDGATIEARITTPSSDPTFSSDFNQLVGGDAYDNTKLLSILMRYDEERGKVDYFYKNLPAVDLTPPTLSTASIETSTDDVLDFVFDESVTITIAGWSIDTDGAALSISSVLSGSGTSTPKFQLSRSVLETETLTVSYDSTTGNTLDLAGNELGDITDDAVSNNVTAVFDPSTISSNYVWITPDDVTLDGGTSRVLTAADQLTTTPYNFEGDASNGPLISVQNGVDSFQMSANSIVLRNDSLDAGVFFGNTFSVYGRAKLDDGKPAGAQFLFHDQGATTSTRCYLSINNGLFQFAYLNGTSTVLANSTTNPIPDGAMSDFFEYNVVVPDGGTIEIWIRLAGEAWQQLTLEVVQDGDMTGVDMSLYTNATNKLRVGVNSSSNANGAPGYYRHFIIQPVAHNATDRTNLSTLP
jgi:hypothetical protein